MLNETGKCFGSLCDKEVEEDQWFCCERCQTDWHMKQAKATTVPAKTVMPLSPSTVVLEEYRRMMVEMRRREEEE